MKKIVFLASLAVSINAFAQIPNYVPSIGLSGWWPFTGNANDQSVNGNHGTVNGATLTTDRFNSANAAYNFNGTSDFINLNTSFASGGNSKSFSLWFRLTDTLYHFIISGGTSSNGNAFGLFYDLNVPFRLIFHGNSNTYDYPFIKPSLNEWYHTVITYDGSLVRAYLNGNFIGSKPVALMTSLADVKVGSRENGTAFFTGKIDDIGIWNRVLTQKEVSELYNGSLTGVKPETQQNTIKVWPNPANDHITIDYGFFGDLTGHSVEITNSLGQQIFHSVIAQRQLDIDLSTRPGNGIYFVRIINENGSTIEIKKIVFQ